MAILPIETQRCLMDLQAQVAPIDPSILEFDPSDPSDAVFIATFGGLYMGWLQDADITRTDDDGHTETLEVSLMGKDSLGRPVIVAQVTTNDGTINQSTYSLFRKLRDMKG